MTTLTPWNDVITTATAYLSDSDPIMANAIERVGPCTLTPNPNLFETLVDAIISQQISVKAADAIMARLRAAVYVEPGSGQPCPGRSQYRETSRPRCYAGGA